MSSNQKMSKEEALAKGLSSSEALDILWAFTGRDLYRLFVIDRKWLPDQYETWLAGQLIQILIYSKS